MSDNLTPEQRSYCMSRVKNKDTGLELALRSALHRKGLRFKKHLKSLPGTPDIVLTKYSVAIFVDGDFWHGYRYPAWKHKVSSFWQKKIEVNRHRDQRNFRKLRKMGWRVIRIWQHEIIRDLNACVLKIITAVESSRRD